MLNITAGLPSEKLGTIEMPLLVTPTEPKKLPLFFVLSVSCEKVESVRCKSAKESNVVLIIFFICLIVAIFDMQSNYTSQSSSNEIQIDHYDIQTEEFFASF